MAMSSPAPISMNIVPCNRCGSNLTGAINMMDHYTIYCQTCVALMGQEVLSLQQKVEKLSNENKMLKIKQDGFDLEMSKQKGRADMVEKAYQAESAERLNILSDREWARNAILFWKTFLDHWKGAKTCPYCLKFEPCPMIKEIEAQATSATPQWECGPCKDKEATMGSMQKALQDNLEFFKHENNCGKCMLCEVSKDLCRTSAKLCERALSDGSGRRMLSRLAASITDFSFLGDNAAILYCKGKYQVLKIDPKKIMTGEVLLMSTADSPKHALDLAKKHQETIATDHVPQTVG